MVGDCDDDWCVLLYRRCSMINVPSVLMIDVFLVTAASDDFTMYVDDDGRLFMCDTGSMLFYVLWAVSG